MPEQFDILGGKFTSTNGRTAATGNAPVISPARTGARARRRQPLKSQGNRRGLVSPSPRQTPQREIKTEKTFREASEAYLREYDVITQGQRSKIYVEGQHTRSRVHLVPFFGSMGLSEITSGKVQDYRMHRYEDAVKKRGKPPAHSTMHQEIVTLRQTLKPLSATAGSITCPTSPSPTGHPRKSRTGHGSRRRNTRSSTKPQDGARTSPKMCATNGNRNSFTITFYFRLTQDCGRTKPGGFSFGT